MDEPVAWLLIFSSLVLVLVVWLLFEISRLERQNLEFREKWIRAEIAREKLEMKLNGLKGEGER